jgi:hypothetical protein
MRVNSCMRIYVKCKGYIGALGAASTSTGEERPPCGPVSLSLSSSESLPQCPLPLLRKDPKYCHVHFFIIHTLFSPSFSPSFFLGIEILREAYGIIGKLILSYGYESESECECGNEQLITDRRKGEHSDAQYLSHHRRRHCRQHLP